MGSYKKPMYLWIRSASWWDASSRNCINVFPKRITDDRLEIKMFILAPTFCVLSLYYPKCTELMDLESSVKPSQGCQFGNQGISVKPFQIQILDMHILSYFLNVIISSHFYKNIYMIFIYMYFYNNQSFIYNES